MGNEVFMIGGHYEGATLSSQESPYAGLRTGE
jgi:hypothetical protein